MRRPRLKASKSLSMAYYHCVSRVVNREFVLGEQEKEQFVAFMRTYESSHFTGAGILDVTRDAPAGYNLWAQTNVDGQTPDEDFDSDGVHNGVEYFFGTTAPMFTPNPALIDGTVTWPYGGNIPSEQYGIQFVVQTSPDLQDWTDVDIDDPKLSNLEGSVS